MNNPPSAAMNRRDMCRRLLGLATASSVAIPWLNTVPSAFADESTGQTMRIEEDWYIKIGTPDPDYDSPQITTVIAPSWTLWGKYAVFDMNCATQPDFSSGGVQIQLWQDDSIIQTASNNDWASMHMIDEEIRYTSAMSIENGNLVFEILNGSSESWGTFGNGELKLQTPTWRDHLNWYDPNFTTSNSRVGFASHRVRRFILERVRYFSADGLQSTDDTSRVLHQYDPQV